MSYPLTSEQVDDLDTENVFIVVFKDNLFGVIDDADAKTLAPSEAEMRALNMIMLISSIWMLGAITLGVTVFWPLLVAAILSGPALAFLVRVYMLATHAHRHNESVK